jgi:hypothetical protein
MMSQMKNFAVWLAKCVYNLRMTDIEIVHACGFHLRDQSNYDHIQWLLTQVQTVRDNPQIFLRML